MSMRNWVRRLFTRRSVVSSHRQRLAMQVLECRSVPAALLVNSPLDLVNFGDSLVTLREAVLAANNDSTTDLGQIGNGADTINFDPSLTGSTITLSGGQFTLVSDVTFDGGTTGVILDGDNASRIFQVNAGSTAAVNSLTLTRAQVGGGTLGPNGGAILNKGTLSVNGCSFFFDSAGSGGVIQNEGKLTLTNSTIANNSCGGNGGAINNLGALTVMNSTIAGNLAGGSGGGIFSDVGSSTKLINTIVAYSYNGDVSNSGNPLTGNNNLITDGKHGLADTIVADPLLAFLANYGGPTRTMALLPGSPAIDAAAATATGAPTTDQRGISRPQGGGVDIGAFESQGFIFASTSGSGQSANIFSAFANPLVVNVQANNPAEPVDGGVVTFTAPAFGASGSMSALGVTIIGGEASVTATANGTAGKYDVVATSSESTANFTLTNLSLPVGPSNLTYQSYIGGSLSLQFGNQGNFIEVFGQAGAITVRVNGTPVGAYAVTGTLTIAGGSGADTITMTVNANQSFPTLVTVNALGGDDRVIVGSSGAPLGKFPNLTMNLGEGNNIVSDSGVVITNSWNINSGAGNDTFGPLVSKVGNRLNITAGDGNNTAAIFSNVVDQVYYKGGSGADNVTVGGTNSNGLYVYLGAGSDTFTFAPGTSIGKGLIDFGADFDTYISNGVFVGTTLTLLNL